MIQRRKNMSISTAHLSRNNFISLEFFLSGSMNIPRNDAIHKKTVPYSILLQVLEGCYGVCCQGEEFMLDSPGIVYIPAGETVTFTHHDSARGNFHSRWLHFLFSYQGLTDFLSFFKVPLRIPANRVKRLNKLIDQAETRSPDPATHLIRRQALITHVLEEICTLGTPIPQSLESHDRQRLRPALHYVRENFTKRIGVSDLSRAAGLSTSRFHTLFRATFNCSPMQYVQKVRLETAARQIIGSPDKLETVAASCGFADAFHLSHAFKAHYGLSPRAYRNQQETNFS